MEKVVFRPRFGLIGPGAPERDEARFLWDGGRSPSWRRAAVAAAFSWNQGSVRAAPRENEDDDDQGTPAFIFTSDRAAMVAMVVMVAVKVVIARIFLPV